MNLLTKADYDGLKHKPKLTKSGIGLMAYNNTEIRNLGKCHLTVTVKGVKYLCWFVVVQRDSPSWVIKTVRDWDWSKECI